MRSWRANNKLRRPKSSPKLEVDKKDEVKDRDVAAHLVRYLKNKREVNIEVFYYVRSLKVYIINLQTLIDWGSVLKRHSGRVSELPGFQKSTQLQNILVVEAVTWITSTQIPRCLATHYKNKQSKLTPGWKD